MSIHVLTDKKIINRLNRKIDNGNIRSWEYRLKKNGKSEYTHTAEQWYKKAYFCYDEIDNGILFSIKLYSPRSLSREVYSIYHGKFLYVLFEHLSSYFDTVLATAEPDEDEPKLFD